MPDDLRDRFLALIPEFRAVANVPDDPDWPTPRSANDAWLFVERLSYEGRLVAALAAADCTLLGWEHLARSHRDLIEQLLRPDGCSVMDSFEYFDVDLPSRVVAWIRALVASQGAVPDLATFRAWTATGRATAHERELPHELYRSALYDFAFDLEHWWDAAPLNCLAELSCYVARLRALRLRTECNQRRMWRWLGESLWAVIPSDDSGADELWYATDGIELEEVTYEFWHKLVRARLAFADAPTASFLEG